MPAWPVRPKSGHAANAAFMSTRSDLIRSPNAHLSEHVGVVPHFDLHETKRHRWDLETVPDLGGFAAANDLVGKSDVEVREAIGDKFPKHIHHSIVCIGALRQGTFTGKVEKSKICSILSGPSPELFFQLSHF